MNILQINASARREGANSTRIADMVTQRLLQREPQARLSLRDLAATPHPMLDEAALGALFTPADKRSAEQAARVALDDALIQEVQAHDVLVIGVPMYNFGVPSQLKNWIDAIARAGVTFRYTDSGPVGMLGGRKIVVFAARGGRYAGTPKDTQTGHVRDFLSFVGIDDVQFVYAEGLAISEESRQTALDAAHATIGRLAMPEPMAA